MRLARVVEGVAGAALVAYSLYTVVSRTVDLSPAPILYSLLMTSGALAVADALGGAWLPASLLAFLAEARTRYRAAPFRLGPLRVWNPEGLLLALVFSADVAVAVLEGGPAGLLVAAAGVPGVAYGVYVGLLAPTTSAYPGVPWWVRVSRLVPDRLRSHLEPLARLVGSRVHEVLGLTRGEAEALAVASLFLGLLAGAGAGAAAGVVLSPLAGLVVALAPVVGSPTALLAIAGARRRSIDKMARQELPFLAAAGALASQAGLGLEWALDRLHSRDFPAAGSLDKAGPARDMIVGYRAMVHSGGDAARFLEAWADKGIHMLATWLRGSLNTLSGAASAIAAVAGLGMSIGLVVALLPQGSPFLIPLFALVIVPASVLMGIVAVEALAPRLLDHYDTLREAAAAVTGAAAGLVLAAGMGLPAWAVMGLALAGGLAGLGIAWRLEKRVIDLEEEGLEGALEQLVELRRLGVPIAEALRAASESVNPVAGLRLRRAWAHALTRGSLEGAHAYWKSWLGRAAMRLLALAEDTGATQPRHILLLSRTVQGFRRARREARAELGMSRAVALAAPPILSVMIVFLESLAAKLEEAPVLLQPVPPFYFAQAKAAVFILATGLGILASKLVDFTVRNTLLAAASLAASLAVLALA